MADNQAILEGLGQMIASISEQYPAFVPLLKIPEIAELILKSSAPGAQWTSQKFQAQLQGTKWWKQNSQPARNWAVLTLTQPGEAARQQAQMSQQVHAAAGTAGIVLSTEALGTLVDNALKNGWSTGQIQQAIGNHAEFGHLRNGTVRQTMTQLANVASDYGLPVSKETTFGWAQRIAEGQATADGFTSYAQQHARVLYPHLQSQLDQGFTVRQIADPYMQVAQQLGVLPNPATANLSNPKWSRALQSRDKDGKITGPMTLDDWSRQVMTDPQYGWDHTSNAREAATNLVQSLGQTFGVMA